MQKFYNILLLAVFLASEICLLPSDDRVRLEDDSLPAMSEQRWKELTKWFNEEDIFSKKANENQNHLGVAVASEYESLQIKANNRRLMRSLKSDRYTEQIKLFQMLADKCNPVLVSRQNSTLLISSLRHSSFKNITLLLEERILKMPIEYQKAAIELLKKRRKKTDSNTNINRWERLLQERLNQAESRLLSGCTSAAAKSASAIVSANFNDHAANGSTPSRADS